MMVPMNSIRPTTADDEAFAQYGVALADAVEAELGSWVSSSFARILHREAPTSLINECRAVVVDPLRQLVAADLDDQRTTPLTIVRRAIPLLTAALREAGAAPVPRDAMLERVEPDDVFGVSPASFAEIGPAVAEAGLIWGAAKAHVHLQRRRT